MNESIEIFRGKRQFILMIILAIAITFIMVVISMALYDSSGAAQLDLSRPGYKDVRAQVVNNDDLHNYPSTGAIDQTTIDEFKLLLNQQIKKAELIDAFGGDPLSPDALGISTGTITNE